MPDAQEIAKLIEAEGCKAVLLPRDITNSLAAHAGGRLYH